MVIRIKPITNYTFVFKGSEFTKVSNTLLFNINAKQKNYHTLIINKTKETYITTVKEPSFKLENKTQMPTYKIFILILIVMGFLFWINEKI